MATKMRKTRNMNKNFLFFWFLSFFIFTSLAGCAPGTSTRTVISTDNLDEMPYTLTVHQAYEAVKTGEVFVLDVREIWEYENGHMPGAVLIPFMEVENRLSEVPTDQHIIVTCRNGNRSAQIAEYLQSNGYTRVHNMQGGILDWKTLNLPIEK